MLSTQPAYLTRRTVGHACPLVAGQIEVSGTGTFVSSSWWEEAEVAAATVVCLARMFQNCDGDEEINIFLTAKAEKTWSVLKVCLEKLL